MHTFFHGWRRKAGCVTLVLACAFCGGWVRSGLKFDFVTVSMGGTEYRIGSFDGALRLIWQAPLVREAASQTSPRFGWDSGELSSLGIFATDENNVRTRTRLDVWKEYDVEWRWDWGGFNGGSATHQNTRTTAYEFRYWSVTIPLTLLSAYLILWKPRKRSCPN